MLFLIPTTVHAVYSKGHCYPASHSAVQIMPPTFNGIHYLNALSNTITQKCSYLTLLQQNFDHNHSNINTTSDFFWVSFYLILSFLTIFLSISIFFCLFLLYFYLFYSLSIFQSLLYFFFSHSLYSQLTPLYLLGFYFLSWSYLHCKKLFEGLLIFLQSRALTFLLLLHF